MFLFPRQMRFEKDAQRILSGNERVRFCIFNVPVYLVPTVMIKDLTLERQGMHSYAWKREKPTSLFL